MPKFPFDDVEGYLSAEDRINLKILAERSGVVKGDYLEIGSYKGLSCLCIMSGMPKDRMFFALDYHEPEKHAEFMANIKAAKADGLNRIIVTRPGDFKTFPVDVNHGPKFAFIFVDHSHSLADTQAAYDMFWPVLAVGGIMCFHDYTHVDYQEPRQFLDGLKHKRILEGSILAFQKE